MTVEQIKEDFSRISPFLDEKTTRLYVSNMVLGMGRGGRLLVSKVLGISRVRINNGIKELLGEVTPVSEDRTRRKGGGRKSLDVHHPELKAEIGNIISPHTRDDPINPLKWCSKSRSWVESVEGRIQHSEILIVKYANPHI